MSITIRTLSSTSGPIDTGTISYKASTPAAIDETNVSLVATDSTIQETTTYTLKFLTSVPLNTGCQVEVTFPSQLTFNSDTLQLVTGSGAIVGSSRTLAFSYDEGDSSIKVTDACNSYSQAGL